MRGIDSRMSRRDFGRLAVSIGGSVALAACVENADDADVPAGRSDPWTLPSRQHAWEAFVDDGPPRHHVLLYLNYTGTLPTSEERETVGEALRTLERAYEWSDHGLLFTLGYSPAYFDRFEGTTLPTSVGLPEPQPLTPSESPTLDRQDAVMHLASNRPEVVLAAEQALFADLDDLNGEPVGARLDGVFERADRRTGFIGEGLPAEKRSELESPAAETPIPEEAPEFMGFRTPFPRNQPSEDEITIQRGSFAGSTTQHVEHLDIDLERWYDLPHEKRVGLMFSPVHAVDDRVGDIGEKLGEFNGVTDDVMAALADHAEEHGYVGHAQKSARGRKDGSPVILRRDFDTTDGGSAGVHFVSLQEKIGDYVYTRRKMAGTNLRRPSGREIDLSEIADIGDRTNHGILEFVTTTHRGNFLVPRRELRALPNPRPG